nr:Chain B, Transcription factor jun-D [Homo sapiens]
SPGRLFPGAPPTAKK